MPTRRVSKYARDLLAQLPPGFKVEIVGNTNHPTVIRPNGEVLRSLDGRPILIAGTPSDNRALRNDVKRIQRVLRGEEI